MKNFKKLNLVLLIIGFIVSGLFCFSQISLAANDSYGLDKAAKTANLNLEVAGQSTPFGVVGKLIAAGLSLVAFIFFVLVLYAGITWMVARGDSSKVDKAKDTLESAIIGLVLVISAYAIVNFVLTALTGAEDKCANYITEEVCSADTTCKWENNACLSKS